MGTNHMQDRRRNAIYIIVATSIFAGLVTGRAIFFTVGYAFIGLMIISFLWAWSSVRWLKLDRRTYARRAQAGRYFTESLSVHNTSFLPKLWLEIYDRSTLPDHQASHVVSNLGSKRTETWDVQTLCMQRGEYALGPLDIVTGDPFGLFSLERKINAIAPVLVYPAVFVIPQFALPAGSLSGGEALRQRAHYITTNAAGIRDYAPGDSLNRIHWKSTAKRDRLLVKEFELDPLADIWLIMDMERSVHTEGEIGNSSSNHYHIPPNTEEYTVSITASLGSHFLNKDRSVGLITYGQKRQIIQVDRGPRQITKLLEMLSVVKATGTTPLDQMITLEDTQFTRGTTVILVTPSTRDGWVTASKALIQRGLKVVAILVDPQGFGGRPGIEKNAAYLSSISISPYIVTRNSDIAQVLSTQF